MKFSLSVLRHFTVWLTLVSSNLLSAESKSLPQLSIQGESFMDPKGQKVRFWGVNLIALYPEAAAAEALAANLSNLQVNLARLHHLLRPSQDWNPGMVSGSLAVYQKDSRTSDPVAWDRFDGLNAALGRQGIYLALPLNASRTFLPSDAEILKTDDADRKAWMTAVEELNARPWNFSIDVYKMLPMVDERAALLNEEFARNLLNHVNPHTGRSYAADPQVLMLEVMNEASTEYAIVCGNRFPDYWHQKLVAKWTSFAAAAGLANPGDIYQPADAQAVAVRAQFFRKLDEDYFLRIQAVVRSTGSKVALEFSNLWRGDNALALHEKQSQVMENHGYFDPNVLSKADDGFYDLSKNRLAGKPFIVGELNQAEGEENIRQQAATRTMLPLAASAYASLHDWSGIVWFAWLHGGQSLGVDGWSAGESRSPELGRMMNDGMMIDHLRTAGLLFRQGLLAPSTQPITLYIDEPLTAGDYGSLMRGKYLYQPGWQNIHGVRKAFSTVPAEQQTASWMTQSPPNPLVSDTGEISKDMQRRQFCVSSSRAEGFSGWLDGRPTSVLSHLAMEGEGFATVILVSNDGQDLRTSQHLILSKTALDNNQTENKKLKVTLRGLAPAKGDKQWYIKLTRSRQAAAMMQVFAKTEWYKLDQLSDSSLELPVADWHECELSLK